MLIYNTLYTTVCPACTCFIFYFCLLITQTQMVLDTGYLSYYDVTDLQWTSEYESVMDKSTIW